MNLFQALGSETSKRIILYPETDLHGLAADFAVFDVDLTAHGEVENHRNLFPAIWAVEGVFHWESMLQQVFAAPCEGVGSDFPSIQGNPKYGISYIR
jgi:hypothetical protein